MQGKHLVRKSTEKLLDDRRNCEGQASGSISVALRSGIEQAAVIRVTIKAAAIVKTLGYQWAFPASSLLRCRLKGTMAHSYRSATSGSTRIAR
jgi:hypothetical protein